MEKAWHKNYPKNVSWEITNTPFVSMADCFEQAVSQYSEKSAYVSFGKQLSYSRVNQLSENFAAYLQNKLKIKKGERIALMCPNTFSFAIAMWGIIRTGGVQVSINPLYSSHELKHQLNDGQIETIIIFSPSSKILAPIVKQTSIKNIIIVYLDDLVDKGLPNEPEDPTLKNIIRFADALEAGKQLTFKPPTLGHDDLLFLQYTGGTTGLSKGAMLSHGNLLANMAQYKEFAKNLIDEGNETIITAIPMYHIFALSVNCLSYFSLGASNVLIANPRDMKSFVKIWQTVKATVFTGVNTLFNGLLHTPGFSEIDFSSLKLTVGGGAPVLDAVSNKWSTVTGRKLKEGYGLSETSPIITLNLESDERYVSGIGIPIPSTVISLRDDNDKEVHCGESGELCVKGPQVMQGYWQNQQATESTMTADGYFKTGDIAQLDEQGIFHIVDRKKDMILVSGFNVFPNEIEAAVADMPGLLESACIGVEDEKSGEAAKLFVVKTDPSLNANDVIQFCRNKLTAYKIPKQVVFIDELPKSTVGKLLRRELRELD